MIVLVTKEVEQYLYSHQLVNTFKKVRQDLEENRLAKARLKKRQPKSSNIWYFRINKKYRAFAKMEENFLLVFEISDHQ